MMYINLVLKTFKPYEVPQNYNLIKLNQNESPYDLPKNIKKEITERGKEIGWNRYPSNQSETFIKRLSEHTNHPPAGIAIGNGSNDLVWATILSLTAAGDRLLTADPTFSIYKRMAILRGNKVVEIPLTDKFKYDIEQILKKKNSVKLIFLPSPNNPTGISLPIDKIESILDNYDGNLVIDEAYFEFSSRTAQTLVRRYENLLILRTFSKAFAAAGLRIGYLLGSPVIIKEVLKARTPYSVGSIQQIAGEILLKNAEWIERVSAEINRYKNRLFTELKETEGISPIPSDANFILLKSYLESAVLFDQLYRRGILVRRIEHPRLRKYIRVTVGTEDENTIFIKNLREILEEVRCRR